LGTDCGAHVVGVGLACLDQLMVWQDMSKPVQENRIAACDMQGGGMAATAMVAVSRLGGRAELWSAVGDDWVGDRILQDLAAYRVDTDQVVRIADGTSLFIAVCIDQPTGERHFLHSSGWTKPDQPVGDLERLATAGCLLIDHALPASELSAAREARRLGVPVVSDSERLDDRNREIFSYIDCAILSEQCARSLGAGDDFQRASQIVQAMGPTQVVITLGARGLAFLDGEEFGHMPSFPVEVVDTTGAGDVFHGAFCYGLVHGYSLRDNLTFASATAAMKCRQIGGRAGIPHRDEVFQFLGERGIRLTAKKT
jgi:sulfofructose kinase